MLWNKIVAFFCLIILLVICAGCSSDADIQLINGYSIIQETNNWCTLVNDDGSSSIPNFYITGYIVHESYILLEGISTAHLFIEDNELNSSERKYYIIDTTSNQIYGILDSELQLQYTCEELSIESNLNWNRIQQ